MARGRVPRLGVRATRWPWQFGLGLPESGGDDTMCPCGEPHEGHLMSGGIQGCWFTKVDTARDNGAPSGI